MESKCHICRAEVNGVEDTHRAWVSYQCACGHSWSESRVENRDKQREDYKGVIHDTL